MNDEKLYLLPDPELAVTATVIRTGDDDAGRFIVLNRSPLHPRGGGQREDHGRVDQTDVLHVIAGADGIQIYHDAGATFIIGQTVNVTADGNWRLLQSRYHTAGHALAASAESLVAGLSAFKAHHWQGEAYVMFRGTLPDDAPAFGTELIAAIARDIDLDLPVKIVGDPLRDRKIAIGEYRPVGCGGTHVTHLGELQSVIIRSVKVKRGELKVGYDVTT